MTRLLIVLVVVAVAFTIYTLVDVLLTERARVRAFPKPVWALGVVLLPVVGGVLWLAVGKARRRGRSRSAPSRTSAFVASSKSWRTSTMTLPPPPSAESVPPSAAASPASAAAMALLAGLVRHGVTDLVLSPGSRSQALALAAAALCPDALRQW